MHRGKGGRGSRKASLVQRFRISSSDQGVSGACFQHTVSSEDGYELRLADLCVRVVILRLEMVLSIDDMTFVKAVAS
jgi:hypothetical protein